jgi:membrane fusion protein (multidrug efflux system)
MTDRNLYILASFMLFVLLQGPLSRYIQQIRAARIVQVQGSIPVKVSTIKKRNIPTTITMSGVIDSEKLIAIKPELRGKITYLREPGKCNEGDLIVQLDDSSQDAAVKKCQAVYMEAKDQHDRAVARKAKKESISTAEIQTLLYRMQSAEAEVKRAESDLKRMSFKAPFKGIVGIYKPGISIGAVAMENQELVSISSGDKVIRFNLPEDSLKYVKDGDTVFVSSSAFDETLSAIVKAKDSKTDSVHSVGVIAKLMAIEDLSFPSGFSAKVIINTSNAEYFCVKESCIISSGKGANKRSYIYVVTVNKEGKKQARRVQISILARSEGDLGIQSDEITLSSGVYVIEEVGSRSFDGRIVEYEEPIARSSTETNPSSIYDLSSFSFGNSTQSSGESDNSSSKEDKKEGNS